MANGYMPRGDMAALQWMKVFSHRLVEQPADYHVTAAEAADLAEAVGEYAAALRLAIDPGTRTPVAVAMKDRLRLLAELGCRPLYARIKSDPSISDAQKINIGVRPMNPSRRRIHAPTTMPVLHFAASLPGVHTILYADGAPPFSSAKPFGVTQLQLFRALGDRPVEEEGSFEYLRSCTRSPIRIRYGATDDLKVVTYLARWITRRGEVGPWSRPLSARVTSVSPGKFKAA